MSRRHRSPSGELPGPTPRSRWQGSTIVDQSVSGVTSHADVLDRVLDKGIVIDAWMRVSVGGLDVITVEARVIVASVGTYLKYGPALRGAAARQSGRRVLRPPI